MVFFHKTGVEHYIAELQAIAQMPEGPERIAKREAVAAKIKQDGDNIIAHLEQERNILEVIVRYIQAKAMEVPAISIKPSESSWPAKHILSYLDKGLLSGLQKRVQEIYEKLAYIEKIIYNLRVSVTRDVPRSEYQGSQNKYVEISEKRVCEVLEYLARYSAELMAMLKKDEAFVKELNDPELAKEFGAFHENLKSWME